MVRAHPTVPAPHSAELPLELPRHLVLWRVAYLRLRITGIHPQFLQFIGVGGLMMLFRTGNFQLGLLLATALSVFDVACRSQGLHPRTGAGLHRRRVPPLQLRNSRCRPCDGLHGRQKVPALAGLPGSFQARCRAARSRGQARGPADVIRPAARKPASAKPARPRRASAEKPAKPASDLTAAAPFQGPLARQTDPCRRPVQ